MSGLRYLGLSSQLPIGEVTEEHRIQILRRTPLLIAPEKEFENGETCAMLISLPAPVRETQLIQIAFLADSQPSKAYRKDDHASPVDK
jgi:hypothetical protein